MMHTLTRYGLFAALLLALTFGVYGLLRKVATLGALEGLTLETMLLAPLAALFGAAAVAIGMAAGMLWSARDVRLPTSD